VCQRKQGFTLFREIDIRRLPFLYSRWQGKTLSGGIMDIRRVGVVGAGVMGTGVAQTLAQTDQNVVLVDLTEEILSRAKRDIRKNLRLHRMLTKDDKKVDPDAVLGRITFTLDVHMLEEVDYIIENVVEKWSTKEDVYARLDALCPKHCIFGSNTSAISITRIASITKRAPQVIGIHFMNPVPLKNTVEMILGVHTSQHTIAVTKELLSRMRQDFVVVKDAPGFVSNRVLMLTINEAISVVQDQVAEAEDVDRIFRACFEHKMGPLETADLIGLDTILLSLEVLEDSYKDSKYRPAPLLRKMVDAGLLGRKSGEGFYRY
jgi:3-hydroxybutyryl-CoA dehydrogenase